MEWLHNHRVHIILRIQLYNYSLVELFTKFQHSAIVEFLWEYFSKENNWIWHYSVIVRNCIFLRLVPLSCCGGILGTSDWYLQILCLCCTFFQSSILSFQAIRCLPGFPPLWSTTTSFNWNYQNFMNSPLE